MLASSNALGDFRGGRTDTIHVVGMRPIRSLRDKSRQRVQPRRNTLSLRARAILCVRENYEFQRGLGELRVARGGCPSPDIGHSLVEFPTTPPQRPSHLPTYYSPADLRVGALRAILLG